MLRNVHNVSSSTGSSNSSHRAIANQPPSYYHLTVSEYGRQCNANPPRRVPFTHEEIKHYAALVVRFLSLAQTQSEAMAHDPVEISRAYARVEPIVNMEKESAKPVTLCTYAEIDAMLADLDQRCKKQPKTFDHRILLITYAMTYLELMEAHILNHPIRDEEQGLKVHDVANREIEHLQSLTRLPPHLASSHATPRATEPVVLIPNELRTRVRAVSVEDLRRWERHPQRLVGLGFINTSSDNAFVENGSTFLVKDMMSSARGGHHFEIQFEDSGEDSFSFKQDQLFELISSANYVQVEPEIPQR